MARVTILKKLGPDQAAAANPEIHAALSASAGTGKTQVLTARVLRLLLGGAAPETILCLTFTKAAAAEMAERVGGRLARWVRLDDRQLDDELEALGLSATPALRARARALFATVLDCPGGLRIQTIHSFCQTILAAFPAEAGITPGFRPIEGREEEALVERTLAALAERSAASDGAFLADLEILAGRLDERAVVGYLRRCAAAREGMAAFRDPLAVERGLRRQLGLPEGDIAALVATRCHDDSFDCALLSQVAAGYRAWGTAATGLKFAAQIEGWLALPADRRCSELGALASILFVQDGGRRKLQAGFLKQLPAGQEHCDALAAEVGELVTLLRTDALVRLMAAGLRAGSRFAEAYARAKSAAGVADFDDLIRWTRDLFAQESIAAWVRYKLDRRTDHLLVDEAQDTNAAQWAIVEALVEEYFAGQGAGEAGRTLFMVGDFKQAIYGFQGTDPAEFEAALGRFRTRAQGGKRPLLDLSINRSFRSSQTILDLVDWVLADLGPERIGLPVAAPRHLAFHADRFGTVEHWPAFALEQVEEIETEAAEEAWEKENKREYTARLADWIAAELARAPLLAATGRPLTAGDILILVRSRANGIAALLVARLFERGVRTAGIDRLVLSEPLAVQDLVAAMAFAVQPLDDLTLASLLVSPLIGFSQDELYEVAGNGRGRPLWIELKARADERPVFRVARDALNALLDMADYGGPHDFLEAILSGPLDGRRKLMARLGRAARDPINELVTAALQFEATETASLQHFLAWFRRGEVEVKRDPEGRGNAVRIMTVHGAKGLEAPLVILADATTNPADLGGVRNHLDVRGPDGSFPVLRPRKAELCPPFDDIVEQEKQRDLREHFRLGYVAMTRAAERLIVAGLKPAKDVAEDSWHARVGAALEGQGVVPDASGKRILSGGVPPEARPERPLRAFAPPAIPAWAREPAPQEERPPRPLAPSQMASDRDAMPPPGPEMRAAAERGRLLHALFERLPATRPTERRAAALEWLARGAGVTDAEERLALVDAALLIVEAPEYADVFAHDALTEAPLAATLPDGTVVTGTVDRLSVTAERIRLLDFKTGNRVPRDADAVPESHRRQMAAYGAALRVIFPDRPVELALLYTAGPRLIRLALEDVGQATHMAGNPNQERTSP